MARQTEPCGTCGDGADAVFQCSTCAARDAAGRRKSSMTDAERHELEKGAAVFGAFAPGGH
jgi:hypothetical protein